MTATFERFSLIRIGVDGRGKRRNSWTRGSGLANCLSVMYRFAHLSDPHLGPLPKARIGELMSKRMLGYLNWRLNRGRGSMRPAVLDGLVADIRAEAPDHVCVTGDIVNIALEAEMEPARAWLASLGSPSDVSLVPGNHDAYVGSSLKQASAAWGPFLWGDGSSHVAFPFVRRRGPVGFVGVSSAKATAPFMATGVFDPSQALLLTETLERLGHEGLFRVVMIHHPPTRGSTHWAARLVGADRFRAVIKKTGAELILHGHTHRPSVMEIVGPNGPVPVVGVPSASANPSAMRRGAGWNLFTVNGRPGAWSLTQVERGFADPSSGPIEIAKRKFGSLSVTS